jgi:hypothetical protein
MTEFFSHTFWRTPEEERFISLNGFPMPATSSSSSYCMQLKSRIAVRMGDERNSKATTTR